MYLGEPMSRRVGFIPGSSPSFIALVNKQQKLSVAGLDEILSSDCTYGIQSQPTYTTIPTWSGTNPPPYNGTSA